MMMMMMVRKKSAAQLNVTKHGRTEGAAATKCSSFVQVLVVAKKVRKVAPPEFGIMINLVQFEREKIRARRSWRKSH